MKRHFSDDMLSRFIDNKLPDKMRAAVKTHLAGCPGCAERAEEIKRMDELVRALPKMIFSEEVDRRFLERFEELADKLERRGLFARVMDGVGESISTLQDVLVPALKPVAVVAFLFAVTFTAFLYTRPGEMVVTAVDGSGYVSKDDGRKWSPVTGQTIISAGDVVRSAEMSNVDISEPGKFSFRLKPGTAVKIAQISPKYRKGETRTSLLKGDVLIDVDPGTKKSAFFINTNTVEAKATGTKFMVSLGGPFERSWVGVLEGAVRVTSLQELPQYPDAPREVTVGAGMKTETIPGKPLIEPLRLLETEWAQLSELYMIGKKTRVALLISAGEDRVYELLAPCAIYIIDEKPRVIPDELVESAKTIEEAVKTGDISLHMQAMDKLKEVVRSNPRAEYNVQLLLFMGAYYHYAGMQNAAVEIFDKVASDYPGSGLVSLAACAKAVILEENLKKEREAREVFKNIINKYPGSPEAAFARRRLQ